MNERSAGHKPDQEPPSFLPSGNSRRIKKDQGPASASRQGLPQEVGDTQLGPHVDRTRKLPTFSPGNTHEDTPRRSSQSQIFPENSHTGTVNSSQAHKLRRSSGSSRRVETGQPLTPSTNFRAPNKPQTLPAPAVHIPKLGHKHVGSKIVSTLLVFILVLILFAGVTSWAWADKQLKHKDMLTDMAPGTATSWLILGSDERDGTAGTGTLDDTPGFRTDTILVLTKPRHGAASLISIPRDSLVTVNGESMKINAAANLGGYRALTEQVEALTGHKIDHTVLISFGGLEGMVNAIGSINLCYDQTVSDPYSGLNWTSGCHDADGGTALAFSRMRYADPKGDFGRAERQRQVIAALAHKATSPSTFMNFSRSFKLASISLHAITVDEQTNPWTLTRMLLAFRDASGDKGVNGSVYWTDPNYYPGGLGSTVLLDDKRNLELFTQLNDGTHEPGTVGGM